MKTNHNAVGYHPHNIFIEVTRDCDNKCLYCRNDVTGVAGEELADYEIYSIIDQSRDMGARQITLTGGEPLMRPDIRDIIGYASGHGMDVLLATSGKLLTEELLSEIDKDRVRIQVSLDSVYKDINDELRGDGSYDAAIKALRLCKKHDIPSQISVTITEVNLPSIPETIEYAISEGFLVKLRQMVPIGRGESKKMLMADDEALNRLFMQYVANPEYFGLVDAEQVPYFCKDKHGVAKVCSAGNGILYIQYNGIVGICPSAKYSVGNVNVRDKPLEKIYSEELDKFRGKRHKDSGFCGRQSVLPLGEKGERNDRNRDLPPEYTDISGAPMSYELFEQIGCKCTG